MPIAVVILLGGGLVLGLFWKRGLLPLLLVSFVVAVGFGIYFGDWSFLRPVSSIWHNLISIVLMVGGYFVIFVVPTIAGTVTGYFLRQGFNKK
jgi:hypothetical protein